MKSNSLDQYISLYTEHRELIDSHSAPALNRLRPAALEALPGKSLPDKHTEGYEKTSLADMYAPDYGVNLARVDIPADVAASFRCDVPNMTTLLGVVVNDSFHPTEALASRLPEGVEFMSLRDAAIKHPDLVERYYGRLAPIDRPAVALNTLLAQDGVFIRICAGVRLDKPLQLVNIFSSPASLMAVRRMLIVVEARAEGRLLVCDHTQSAEVDYLASQVVEIYMDSDARFDYYDIEESTARTRRNSSVFVRQGDRSNLLINGMTLWNGSTRNDYDVDIVGDGCETLLAGMAIGSGSQHIDNDTQVNHRGAHCHSTQLFKYVLDQESTGAFEGSILVTGDAPFTEAYQSNRNILASPTARMHTKPQLEIYNDDVRCSHGATTGQLDAEALFYMRTRGIPEQEARTMLMQAFMTDVIDTVRLESLRDRLRHLVEKRFGGEDASCSDCHRALRNDCHKK